MIYIGLDDTDNLDSRGTGHLARGIAEQLVSEFSLLGVTRHQLLVDPRIRYTAKNSCAAICLDDGSELDLEDLLERVSGMMSAEFVTGSDPGLCVANAATAQEMTPFGQRAQREVLPQVEALRLAGKFGALLQPLGGDGSGVIGALAAVGLAASGDDGRYVQIGRSRQLSGMLEVSQIIDAGILSVQTLDGQPVRSGLVLADKLRPSRRCAQAILYVEWVGDHWQPLKLD
jgi:tRNA(Ile2) C34 agmatinyltransferase TiaS